ncbi:MAG: hypothetical protein ABFD84_08720 [Candidatus Polarisedimenticolia bacterium]|nr:hypothetical protein [bacterium]
MSRRRFDAARDGARAALVLLGVIAANVVVYRGLVVPARAALDSAAERREKAAETERGASVALQRLREADGRVAAARRGVERFYGEMLATPRERLVSFQKTLLAVGADYGVEPSRFGVSVAERADEGLETVTASLPLEGGYENLRSFLADLEAQEQFIVVRQVGLGGGKEGGRNLQLGVVAETYFAAEGRAPGAPPSPPRAPRPEKGAAR